jgi:hypothetical protein
MLEPINVVVWFEFEWHAASASNGREAFEQHSQPDACLQTCQRSSQAEMNALTQAQVTIGGASDSKDMSKPWTSLLSPVPGRYSERVSPRQSSLIVCP